MTRNRWLAAVLVVAVVFVVVVAWLVAGRDEADTTTFPTASPAGPVTPAPGPGPTPTATSTPSPAAADAQERALAAVLVATDVPPAPPGTAVVLDPGPVAVSVVDVPTVQVESCSTLIPSDTPGPPEPDAEAGAVTSFVTGVAQVDQYVVAYRDETAAATALDRHRALTEECQAALQARVTADNLGVQATVSEAPTGVDGYRLQVLFTYPSGPSDEASGVFRSGSLVAFTRTNETGAPEGSGWEADGILDPAWVDQLMAAAADTLVAAASID
jgi:hypothetical protein